jgi:hypothetical protein
MAGVIRHFPGGAPCPTFNCRSARTKRLFSSRFGNPPEGDRLEEHRTVKRAYRKQVENEIALIESLLAKLKST